MNSKFAGLIFGASLLLASCAPSAYLLKLENMTASSSGLDLKGKSMSVLYLESRDGADSLLNNRIADAMALKLEDDYFDGQSKVGVYHMVKNPDGDYSSIDSISRYIVNLNTDVLFVLDTPFIGQDTSALHNSQTLPASIKMYAYDSMGDNEDITTFSCSSILRNLNDTSKAVSIGNALSTTLSPQWVEEEFILTYFDSIDSGWYSAIEYANDLNWKEAIDIWMGIVSRTKDVAMNSCARYNIAVACFIQSQYELAKEWLDSSDKIYPVSLNTGLREKIEKKVGQ